MAEAPKYSKSACATGLTHFQCEGPAPDPVKLIGRLAKLCPAYLAVDLPALEEELPEGLEPAYLFDWLPDEARRASSPAVVRCTPAHPEALIVVKKAWGAGGMVCFYSKHPAKDVLERLRHVTRQGSPEGEVPRSVLGVCWPAAAAALLKDGMPKWVHSLFEVFDVAIMEAEDGEGWQAFAKAEFENILMKLGFAEVARQSA